MTAPDTSKTDLLATARVAILGLGLMGGSLALALRDHCAILLGVDPDPTTLALARQLNIVDRTASEPADLLPEADLIVLAAPVQAIIDLLHELPALHPEPAVVLDLGSTKVRIMEAMDSLPERFDPIGGHPMCGIEKSSLAYADARMFQGAPFAFTPLPRTSPRAYALTEQLACTIGARPIWLDPATHDRWTAATSHFPYLLSNALAFITPSEVSPIVGPGFRSTSRLAASSLTTMMDILTTNRENVLATLSCFREHLDLLADLLTRGDFTTLEELLSLGAERQKELTGDVGPGGQP